MTNTLHHPTKISPQFTTKTFGPNPTLDEKILIFEDRELGWRFNIAKATEIIPDAGYAVISILFAYFEMVAQYSTGHSSEGKSGIAFRNGVRLVYSTRTFGNDQLDTIFSRVRCGMFHDGYTKCGTVIGGGFSDSLDIDKNTVRVNPHKLRADLYTHFTEYVAMVKDVTRTQERAKFEKIFDAGMN